MTTAGRDDVWYKPTAIDYQSPDYRDPGWGIITGAPAGFFEDLRSKLPGGANSAIPAGYTRYGTPMENSGYDNKQTLLDFISGAGALDASGQPVTSATYGQTYYLPNDTLSSVPTVFDRDPDTPSTGVLGALGPLGNAALAIASMIPVTAPFAAPLYAGLNAVNGLQTGNLGQVAMGALGLPGVGSTVNNAIGSGLNTAAGALGTTISPSVLPYLTKGVTSAGVTALSGGDLGAALTNGVASGAGAYGGAKLASALPGSLPASVSRGIEQAGVGALTSAIKGGDIGRGALLSGIGGFASGLGSDVGGGTTGGITSALTRKFLTDSAMSGGGGSRTTIAAAPTGASGASPAGGGGGSNSLMGLLQGVLAGRGAAPSLQYHLANALTMRDNLLKRPGALA